MMEKLPREISSDILSRLPFDSVMQCKSVSKSWYDLFQLLIFTSGERHFAQTHRNRLMENHNHRSKYSSLPKYSSGGGGRLSLMLDDQDYPSADSSSSDDSDDDTEQYYSSLPDSVLLVLDQQQQQQQLHYAEYKYKKNKNKYDKNWAFKCKAIKKLNNCPFDMINPNFWTMATSSNGLICSLVHHHVDDYYLFYICNPFLGEYVTLPANNYFKYSAMAFGFGHVPSTDEYKVVRIVYPPGGGDVGNIEVYTLGGGGGEKSGSSSSNRQWRSKGNIKRRLQCDSPGVLVNGSLHWLTEEDERYNKKIDEEEIRQKIITFDLLEEEFDYEIGIPPYGFHDNFKIKEWGGCLWGFDDYTDESRKYMTWKFFRCRRHLRKNKWIVEGGEWDRIFSIEWEGPEGCEHCFFWIKPNQALLWTSNSSINSVQMDGGGPKINAEPHHLEAVRLFHGIFHIKSFVSLKALGENNTKTIKDDDERKRKRENNNHNNDKIMNTKQYFNLKKLKCSFQSI